MLCTGGGLRKLPGVAQTAQLTFEHEAGKGGFRSFLFWLIRRIMRRCVHVLITHGKNVCFMVGPGCRGEGKDW